MAVNPRPIIIPNESRQKVRTSVLLGFVIWDLGFGFWDFFYPDGAAAATSAMIAAAVNTVGDAFARRNTRSTSSSLGAIPWRSSQNTTFDLPDIGPISISCDRPTSR